MLKGFVEKIVELGAPHVLSVAGRDYSSKQLHPLTEPCPENLEINSITGLVDYINNGIDAIEPTSVMIHVLNHEEVFLRSHLFGPFDQRKTYVAVALPESRRFPFGQWLEVENFIIELQAKFVQDEITRNLISFVSNIKEKHVMQAKDDGFSQTVVAKKGISLADEVKVPNPVSLRPFRTFLEIEQPTSSFVFRLRSGSNLPEVSLHEADGGQWKLEAIRNIRNYLRYKLPDIAIVA